MGDNRASAGGLGFQCLQGAGDIGIGEAVKAVALDALVEPFARNGEAPDRVGLGPVKGGVEGGGLGETRFQRGNGPDEAEICGWCSGASVTRLSMPAKLVSSILTASAKRSPPWTTRWPTAETASRS